MEAQMFHTCTVERDEGTTVSASNLPVESWGTHLTNLICRYTPKDGEELLQNDASFRTVVEFATLAIPSGADVTERDRIASIKLTQDTTLVGPFEILKITQGFNHVGYPVQKNLLLKRII